MSRIEEGAKILEATHEEVMRDLEKDDKAIIFFYSSLMNEIKGYVYAEFRADIQANNTPFKLRDLAYRRLEIYVNKLMELSKKTKMPSMAYIAKVIENFIIRDIRDNRAINEGKLIAEAIINFADGTLKSEIKSILRKDLKRISNIEDELLNL